MQVLLITGDDDVATWVECLLLDEDIDLDVAPSSLVGVHWAKQVAFDVILFDPRSADASGLEFLRRLRHEAIKTPVAIVADEAVVERMSRGFGIGADAYVKLPADADELVGAIYHLSGRARPMPFVIEIGKFRLEFGPRVKINGQRVGLTGSERRIVELLARRRGEILTKEDMFQHLYGRACGPEIKIIDVFMSHARKIMSGVTGGRSLIETVWGKGYRLPAE